MIESVTEKKLLEDDLLFALCNSMREGAAIFEKVSRKFIYCNKTFLDLFGIGSRNDIEIIIGFTLRKNKLTPEELSFREQIIRQKGTYAELVEYQPLNGRSFFGEMAVRYFVKNGTEYYLYTINPVDKAFFELASVGIMMVNDSGTIVNINAFGLQQFGYRKEEVVGEKVEMLVPQRLQKEHAAKRKGFTSMQENRVMGNGPVFLGLRKDGSEFPAEISLGNYNTDTAFYTIVFINDISVRKKAEAELKSLNAQLEQLVQERTSHLRETMQHLEASKEALLRLAALQKALLDNAGAMIISVNVEGVIQTFNPEAERKLGYKASELVGIHTPVIFHEPELLKKRRAASGYSDDSGIRFITDRIHNEMPLEEEWIFVSKDGTQFPVRLNLTAVKDMNGCVNGFMGVATDITEVKQHEKLLSESLQKEKELGELKSRFVSMASHEFRTPLSTILSSAYLVEKYTDADGQSKREKHLSRIVASVNMLTDTLNDFLSVGRIEEGKIQVRPISFNLQDMVRTVMDEMKHGLKKGQKILYRHKGDAVVDTDPSLLKHILMNLLSNAGKFSPESTSIKITTVAGKDQVVLSVKDQGMGISKEDQAHLAERFFRTETASNIQGTGLGLHIVSKYAELLNGDVQCKSEPGKGTEFIVTLNTKTETHEKNTADRRQ